MRWFLAIFKMTVTLLRESTVIPDVNNSSVNTQSLLRGTWQFSKCENCSHHAALKK